MQLYLYQFKDGFPHIIHIYGRVGFFYQMINVGGGVWVGEKVERGYYLGQHMSLCVFFFFFFKFYVFLHVKMLKLLNSTSSKTPSKNLSLVFSLTQTVENGGHY